MHYECLENSNKGICHNQRTVQIQNEQYTPKQKFRSVNSHTQTLYVQHLSGNTKEDDLYELFGVRTSTKYLK